MNSGLKYWQQVLRDYLVKTTPSDGAHDISHLDRVWNNCCFICDAEAAPADRMVILVAAYFHDIVSLSKDHPERAKSSLLSAAKTADVLNTFEYFPVEKIPAIQHAIHAHSFSAQVTPETIEARILQDADRLDALGAIGLARVFYVSGQMNRSLFDPEDIFADRRSPDDSMYALDHFKIKLFRLPEMMHTDAAKRLAGERVAWLKEFMLQVKKETGTGNYAGTSDC
ncbi:HD domain-containing protein [Chitinophagaceae bacterium MMS25-I14]